MICPLIDSEDERCASNMRIDNLEMALAICGDAFTECPIYRERVEERAQQHARERLEPVRT